MQKTKITAAALLIVMLILSGCGSAVPQESSISAGSGDAESAENAPMPDDFSLCFWWWIDSGRKNFLDTQSGMLQKDLVTDGTASAPFTPGKEFLQTIYRLVCRCHLSEIEREMTAEILKTDKNSMMITPNTYYLITVTMNGKRYIIRGDETARFYAKDNQDAADFTEAVDRLRTIVSALPAWQELPRANGGYD